MCEKPTLEHGHFRSYIGKRNASFEDLKNQRQFRWNQKWREGLKGDSVLSQVTTVQKIAYNILDAWSARKNYTFLAILSVFRIWPISKAHQNSTRKHHPHTPKPSNLSNWHKKVPKPDSKCVMGGAASFMLLQSCEDAGLFIWSVSTLWGHPESGCILYAWVVYTCREKGYLRLQTAPRKGGGVEG